MGASEDFARRDQEAIAVDLDADDVLFDLDNDTTLLELDAAHKELVNRPGFDAHRLLVCSL